MHGLMVQHEHTQAHLLPSCQALSHTGPHRQWTTPLPLRCHCSHSEWCIFSHKLSMLNCCLQSSPYCRERMPTRRSLAVWQSDVCRAVYQKRFRWCHSEAAQGTGCSVGMMPCFMSPTPCPPALRPLPLTPDCMRHSSNGGKDPGTLNNRGTLLDGHHANAWVAYYMP